MSAHGGPDREAMVPRDLLSEQAEPKAQHSQPEIEGLIERVTAFAVHAQRMYDNGGSLIFCSGKTLRPADLSALLSLKEGGGLGSSSAESAALLASQASCSATPSSTGKED